MSKNPERFIFDDDRNAHTEAMGYAKSMLPKPFVRDGRGWILFGPQDVRGQLEKWRFALMKLPGQKTPRVRVGCRYFTLREAWVHWGARKSPCYSTRRNERAQAVVIIRLMLLQAQAYGLLSIYATPIRFDSTIVKPKRK